jgi:hypothetical protein
VFNMSNNSVATEKDAFEKRAKMGIPESRVRYSTGIAETEDLIQELEEGYARRPGLGYRLLAGIIGFQLRVAVDETDARIPAQDSILVVRGATGHGLVVLVHGPGEPGIGCGFRFGPALSEMELGPPLVDEPRVIRLVVCALQPGGNIPASANLSVRASSKVIRASWWWGATARISMQMLSASSGSSSNR